MKAAYLLALDDLPLEAVQAAAREVFRHETFMPVPAVVRSYAKAWIASAPRRQPMLALYEPDLLTAQVRALIASVWPEEGPYAPQQDGAAAAD